MRERSLSRCQLIGGPALTLTVPARCPLPSAEEGVAGQRVSCAPAPDAALIIETLSPPEGASAWPSRLVP